MKLTKPQINMKRDKKWGHYYKYENKCLVCGHIFEFISKTLCKNTIIEIYECTECGEVSIRKRSKQ